MDRVRLSTLALGIFAVAACSPAPRDANDGHEPAEVEAPPESPDVEDEATGVDDSLPQDADCRVDADCVVSGCGSQICAPEARMTTCIFKPEFACYQVPASPPAAATRDAAAGTRPTRWRAA